jgi:hypothetical protein
MYCGMRFAIALLIAAITVTSAGAEITGDKAELFRFKQDGKDYVILVPPQKWLDVPPRGRTIIKRFPAAKVNSLCSKYLGGQAEGNGCALVMDGGCIVTINEDLPQSLYEIVLLHELAHCAGWPADHPTD